MNVLLVQVQCDGPVGLRQRRRGEISRARCSGRGSRQVSASWPPPRSSPCLPSLGLLSGSGSADGHLAEGPKPFRRSRDSRPTSRPEHAPRPMNAKIRCSSPKRPVVRTFCRAASGAAAAGRASAAMQHIRGRAGRPGEMTTRVPGSGSLRPCPAPSGIPRADHIQRRPYRRPGRNERDTMSELAYEDIKVGDEASLTRTITKITRITSNSTSHGRYEPGSRRCRTCGAVDVRRAVAHGALVARLRPAVLGARLPGPILCLGD